MDVAGGTVEVVVTPPLGIDSVLDSVVVTLNAEASGVVIFTVVVTGDRSLPATGIVEGVNLIAVGETLIQGMPTMGFFMAVGGTVSVELPFGDQVGDYHRRIMLVVSNETVAVARCMLSARVRPIGSFGFMAPPQGGAPPLGAAPIVFGGISAERGGLRG